MSNQHQKALAAAMTDIFDVVTTEMRTLIDLEKRGGNTELVILRLEAQHPEQFVRFVTGIYDRVRGVAQAFAGEAECP